MGWAQSSRGAAGYLAAAATALRSTAASLWERSGCRSVCRAHPGVRVSFGSIAPPAQSPSRVEGWLPHSDQRRPEAPPPVGYVPNEIIRDANAWRPVLHSTDLVVSGFATRAGVITARPPRLRATSAPIILDTFGKGKFGLSLVPNSKQCS
jgi:hypothetical protein